MSSIRAKKERITRPVKGIFRTALKSSTLERAFCPHISIFRPVDGSGDSGMKLFTVIISVENAMLCIMDCGMEIVRCEIVLWTPYRFRARGEWKLKSQDGSSSPAEMENVFCQPHIRLQLTGLHCINCVTERCNDWNIYRSAVAINHWS